VRHQRPLLLLSDSSNSLRNGRGSYGLKKKKRKKDLESIQGNDIEEEEEGGEEKKFEVDEVRSRNLNKQQLGEEETGRVNGFARRKCKDRGRSRKNIWL
jgi:hypothetical protein